MKDSLPWYCFVPMIFLLVLFLCRMFSTNSTKLRPASSNWRTGSNVWRGILNHSANPPQRFTTDIHVHSLRHHLVARHRRQPLQCPPATGPIPSTGNRHDGNLSIYRRFIYTGIATIASTLTIPIYKRNLLSAGGESSRHGRPLSLRYAERSGSRLGFVRYLQRR